LITQLLILITHLQISQKVIGKIAKQWSNLCNYLINIMQLADQDGANIHSVMY